MESDFFAYMYRLKHIKRWSLIRNTMKENVAEALISYSRSNPSALHNSK
jgi:HD containing hydrolase-like enzyme